MHVGKVCKSSIRYESDDPTALITNVYVNKSFSSEMPDKIIISISQD
jgi:hypothetical protein